MDELIDRLVEAAAGNAEVGALLQEAADAIEAQASLLQTMNEFVSSNRDEFEDGLTYEEQEKYREYFEYSGS